MRRTLRRGDRGSDVRDAQSLLASQGYPISLDGDFGPGTESAVVQFQIGRSLGADGIVGPATWSALERGTPTRVQEVEKDSTLNDQQQWAADQIPAGIDPECRYVLEAAIQDLGADEIPDGSNWGPEIQHLVAGYNEYWKTGDSTRYPWCAMACSTWIGIGVGLGSNSLQMDWSRHPFSAFFGGAAQIEDWGKRAGCYQPSNEGTPAPAGSVFTMSRGGSGSDPSQSSRAGHAGLVICDNGDGTFTTIEGNVSNGVRCKIRKHADVNGFVRWWDA